MKVKRRQRTIPMDGLGKVRPQFGNIPIERLPKGFYTYRLGHFFVTLQLKEHASQRSTEKNMESNLKHLSVTESCCWVGSSTKTWPLTVAFFEMVALALKNVMAFWPLRCWHRLRLDIACENSGEGLLDLRCQQTGNSKVGGKESQTLAEKCWTYVLCNDRPLIA